MRRGLTASHHAHNTQISIRWPSSHISTVTQSKTRPYRLYFASRFEPGHKELMKGCFDEIRICHMPIDKGSEISTSTHTDRERRFEILSQGRTVRLHQPVSQSSWRSHPPRSAIASQNVFLLSSLIPLVNQKRLCKHSRVAFVRVLWARYVVSQAPFLLSPEISCKVFQS